MTPTTPPDDDLFAFCARNANPELWRTTVPLIVRVLCNGHKGLIATWTAIHWLIVLWSASGRRAFGVREIAQEAGVGRNELTGPDGYIQRLVNLDLIRIVGYQNIPGLAAPRPIYAIDLWELEQQSMQLVPDMLRERGLPPPPRPAPDPRQLSFLDQIDPRPDSGPADPPGVVRLDRFPRQPDAIRDSRPDSGPVPPGADTVSHALHAHCPENGTGIPESGQDCPATRTVTHDSGTVLHESVPVPHDSGTDRPDSGTALPESVTDVARFRDIEGKKERENDRAREYITRSDLSSFVDLITHQVTEQIQAALMLQHPQDHNQNPTVPPIPDAPAHEPPLPANPLTLWQADRSHVNQRDQFQLELLAGQYDGVTGGHGAYWVGRAILMADLCLEPKGQRATIAYLKAMLKRWHESNSWGSDLDTPPPIMPIMPAPASAPPDLTPVPAPAPADSAPAPADSAPAPTATRPAVPPASASAGTDHPAVACYIRLTSRTPRPHQVTAIAAAVTDLAAWERVIREWQDHGWNEKNITGLLDRYFVQTGQKAPDQVSDSAIVTASIDGRERQRWIARFRDARTMADKRAVLERFQAELPTMKGNTNDEDDEHIHDGDDGTPGAG